MVTVRGHGLAVDVGSGWEARMWLPDLPPPAINRPVVRLANVALPFSRNTYADDVAETLAPGAAVASLVEFDPRLAGRGLYSSEGVPAFGVSDLDPRAVQIQGEGRAGLQRFFSLGGRAFSLYVMGRRGPGLARALEDLNGMIRTLSVEAT
jgi:hypothetical protein